MIEVALLFGILGQSISPIDAYRANFHSIRAEAEFEFHQGRIERPPSSETAKIVAELWSGRPFKFDADPANAIVGSWSCDGTAQHMLFSSPPEYLEQQRGKAPVNGAARTYTPETEYMYDDSLVIRRHSDPLDPSYHLPDVDCFQVADDGRLYFGVSPLMFRWGKQFPSYIEDLFPGMKPGVKAVAYHGRPLETEIYARVDEERRISDRIEVGYDPSIGYLPRVIRELMTGADINEQDRTVVLEMHIVDAQPCDAGGFIPTEWYKATYEIVDFERKYPGYTVFSNVAPDDRLQLGHFRARKLRRLGKPISLTKMDGVKFITYHGKFIKLARGSRGLSLATVKSLISRNRPSDGSQGLPQLTAGDARSAWSWNGARSSKRDEMDASPDRVIQQPSTSARYYVYVAGVVAVSAAIIFFFVRRKRNKLPTLVLILLVMTSNGCSRQDLPPSLAGRFKEISTIYDAGAPVIALTLEVRNGGGVPLELRSASGGCSCRQIDAAALPASLKPDEAISFPVRLNVSPKSYQQLVGFTFETDYGAMEIPVTTYAYQRDQLDNEEYNIAVRYDESDTSFDVVHRHIMKAGDRLPGFELSVPLGFRAARTKGQSRTFPLTKDLVAVDTSYRVTIADAKIGAFKDQMILKADDDKLDLRVPILWRKLPYLYMVPERAVLVARPLRMKLQCVDENVGLTKVLSAPPGILVQFPTEREVSVRLVPDAPQHIDGSVVLATSATGAGNHISFPVIRYTPTTK